MEVENKKTKLIFPHDGKELTVIYSPILSGSKYEGKNYLNLREGIKEIGLAHMITSPELSSLLFDAYLNKGQEFPDKIVNAVDDFCIISSTEYLRFPKVNGELDKGVIVYDNSNLGKEKFSIEKSELMKKLEDADIIQLKGHPVFISKDKTVRYTPFGFKTGEMNPSELASHPYNIALNLEEGADKIARVSSFYKNSPRLFFDNPLWLSKEERGTNSLESFNGHLEINPHFSRIGGERFSLGVLKE